MLNQKENFKTIYNYLKEDIINGVYAFGALLPTQEEVAQRFSVSRPTISKVYLALQENGYIRKKRGYGNQIIFEQPSSKAKYIIGLLLPGAGESEIFSVINDQLLHLSEEGDYNFLWEGTAANNAQTRRSMIEFWCKDYIKKEVDGILFSPVERIKDSNQINIQICNEISKANIPLVLIDRDIVTPPERSKYDLVGIDNFNAGCIMAKHLLDAGCEVVHFFYRPYSASSVDLRLSGVKDTVLKNNFLFNNQNIYCGDPADIEFVKSIKIDPGKTGIVCANDSTAAVLISSLDSIGYKISSDVLICGYDNMRYSDHLKFSLTSYEQPCKEIAIISVELILRRIKNKKLMPVKVNLEGEIKIRESSIFQ